MFVRFEYLEIFRRRKQHRIDPFVNDYSFVEWAMEINELEWLVLLLLQDKRCNKTFGNHRVRVEKCFAIKHK